MSMPLRPVRTMELICWQR